MITRLNLFCSLPRTASSRRDRFLTRPLTSLEVWSRTRHPQSSACHQSSRPAPTSHSPRRCLQSKCTRSSGPRESTRGTKARDRLEQRRPRKPRSEQLLPLEKEVQAPGQNRLIHFYKVIHWLFHQRWLLSLTVSLESAESVARSTFSCYLFTPYLPSDETGCVKIGASPSALCAAEPSHRE